MSPRRISLKKIFGRRPADAAALEGYGYFDEAYFERGHLRGTAYVNYLRASRRSPTYRELAERIVRVFRPARALEIGCATGITVKHLNDLGCEAHGVDVSKWAVDHREHPNIVRTGAEEMPFEDRFFDLVYSVHALEHIPSDVEHAALREMTRVSTTSGLQFHMLPIMGRGPYGSSESVEGLRQDPTHNLIRTLEEWGDAWGQHGWRDTRLLLFLRHDTETFELASCQFILARAPVPDDVADRLRDSNVDVVRMLFIEAERASARSFRETRLDVLASRAPLDESAVLIFRDDNWHDVQREFVPALSVKEVTFHVTTTLTGTGSQRFRLALANAERDALVGDFRHVSERWFEIPLGLAHMTASFESFSPLRGNLDPNEVSMLLFGGAAAGSRIDVRVEAERAGEVTRLL